MAGNSASGQLHRLHAELEELSGGRGLRPPSIAEALAAASEAVRRRQAAMVARAEMSPPFSALRAAALTLVGIGGWLATQPRRKAAARPAVREEVRTARRPLRSRMAASALRAAGAALRRRSRHGFASGKRWSWGAGVGAGMMAGMAASGAWFALRRRRRSFGPVLR